MQSDADNSDQRDLARARRCWDDQGIDVAAVIDRENATRMMVRFSAEEHELARQMNAGLRLTGKKRAALRQLTGGSLPENFSASECGQVRTAQMKILFGGPPKRKPKPIPFWEKIVKAGGVLDEITKKEWVDDAERRMRGILLRINPRPILFGYVLDRVEDVLTLYTVTAEVLGKHQIGLLSSGEWPGWSEIIKAAPEFDQTEVVFEGVSLYEWFRRWDMNLQGHRIQAQYGIFG